MLPCYIPSTYRSFSNKGSIDLALRASGLGTAKRQAALGRRSAKWPWDGEAPSGLGTGQLGRPSSLPQTPAQNRTLEAEDMFFF